jgi:hypothetical protein
VISYQGVRHGGYGSSACVTEAADAYLLAGTPPAGDTLCPE